MTDTHSAEFIGEMKEKLLAEQALLMQELGEIAKKQGDEYQAKYPEYGEHEDENATEITDYQALVATTKANEERLQSVNQALQRLEQGNYGVTDDGEMIPEARLRANPAAITLVK